MALSSKLIAAFFPVTLVVVVLSALVGGTPTKRAPIDRRRRILEEARHLDGLSAGEQPQTFAAALGVPPPGGWEDLIARPFSIETREDGTIQTAGVSTCALVAREILRRSGLELASLEAPYVPGSAMREIVEVARKTGALHVRDGYEARPGDLVVLGVGSGDHVATLVALEGDSATTIDGGLVAPDGLQRIGHVTRTRAGIGASVLVVDVDRLPWKA